jgi:SAM-dependent methyltransferase
MFSIERLWWFFRALDNLFDTNDWKKAINALDFWAWNWFIWENINKYLQKKWHKVRMNYNDLNIDFLKSKENVYNLDNKNLFQIETSSIDLIVWWSVLHYEENTDLQIKVLKELHRILKDDWKILYQWFVCNSLLEKDFFSFVWGLAWRKQMLHTQEEWINIFIKWWFSIMKINHNDFIWRQTDVDYFWRFFKNTDSNKKKKITDKIINKIKWIKDISNQIKYKWNTFERNIRYDLFLLWKS